MFSESKFKTKSKRCYNIRSDENDPELKDTPETIDLPEMVELYDKVINFFKSHRPMLNYFEVKPKIDKITEEKHSLDYINFIIIFGDYEYLVFLKTSKPGTLTYKELERYFYIFSKDTRKEGIIIIWNDSELHSVKLGEADYHAEYEEVLEDIKQSLTPLKDILEDEIEKTKKISNTLKIPEKQFTKEISLDIINVFKRYLHNSYETKKDRYRSQRRELLSSINLETFENINKLFTDYFLKRVEKESLEENYKKIIEENFKND